MPSINASSEIMIYDISGRKFMSESLMQHITVKEIDIRKLTVGVYLIIIIQNNKKQTLKLIKN